MSDRPRLFGEVALEKRYVTIAEVYRALTLQAREEVEGRPYRFLGEILTDLGYMSEPQVLEVLHELHATESAT